MNTQHKYIGLDVHSIYDGSAPCGKDQNQVAIADAGKDGELRLYGSISNDLYALGRSSRFG